MDTDRQRDLLAQLTAGVERLTTSDAWSRYLQAQARFHRYSFGNTLLIMAQSPEATQVAGFKTWIHLDRHVRKGEHAVWILAPMVGNVTKTDDDGQETAHKVLRGFRAVPVFDLAQTDGADLPSPLSLLQGEDEAGAFETLARVAKGWGWTVADADAGKLGAANGMTCHLTREILVSAERSPLQRVKTLTHEMGHALLHGEDCTYRADRGLVELEAESVAYVVCGSLGLSTDNYSLGYVAGWSGDGETAVAAIKTSGERIQRAAAQVLTALEDASAHNVAA
jgi:antirestriction protein ArdC